MTQLIATSFIRWNASEWRVQVFFNLVRSARCEYSLSLCLSLSHFYFVLFLFTIFFHTFFSVFLFSFHLLDDAPFRPTLHSFFSQSSSLSLSLCNNRKFSDLMGNDIKNTITSQHQLSKATFTIKLIDFSSNQWLWKHFKMNVNYNRPPHMIRHIPKDALTILTFFNLP